jgi:hypothetical protein
VFGSEAVVRGSVGGVAGPLVADLLVAITVVP